MSDLRYDALEAEFETLRAWLEETERERDDYHQKALDIADQRDGFRDRAEAAERERDEALKHDEAMTRQSNWAVAKAEAAEDALKRAGEAWCARKLDDYGCTASLYIEDVEALDRILGAAPPAEPLRTEGDVEPVEHCLHGRVVFGDPCPECCAMLNKAVAESLRTEGAPKQEEARHHPDCSWLDAPAAGCDCGKPMHDLRAERDALRAQVETLEKGRDCLQRERVAALDDADALRASLSQAKDRVEEFEKALRAWALWMNHFNDCKACAEAALWCPEWYRLQDEAMALTAPLFPAALAPEAPVEKEEGT